MNCPDFCGLHRLSSFGVLRALSMNFPILKIGKLKPLPYPWLPVGTATADPVRCPFLNLMLAAAEILSKFSERRRRMIPHLKYSCIQRLESREIGVLPKAIQVCQAPLVAPLSRTERGTDSEFVQVPKKFHMSYERTSYRVVRESIPFKTDSPFNWR